MMNLTLYQVADEYLGNLKALEDSNLPDEVIQDTLEGLSGDLEVKAINVAAYFQNLEAEAKAIKEAEVKMANRRKSIENRVDRFREYLRFNMERCGIKEIKSAEFTLLLKQNPPAVVIDDEKALPNFYKRMKEIIEVDKTAIKEAIKNGEQVIGAHLETKTRLEVR